MTELSPTARLSEVELAAADELEHFDGLSPIPCGRADTPADAAGGAAGGGASLSERREAARLLKALAAVRRPGRLLAPPHSCVHTHTHHSSSRLPPCRTLMPSIASCSYALIMASIPSPSLSCPHGFMPSLSCPHSHAIPLMPSLSITLMLPTHTCPPHTHAPRGPWRCPSGLRRGAR